MFFNTRTTQFDHNSPVQHNPDKNIGKNLKKSQKINFLYNKKLKKEKKLAVKKKKKNAILLVFNIRRTGFNQSSPVA